jgi:hypothetical protein
MRRVATEGAAIISDEDEDDVFVLNHANTVSVEDNVRKRSYSHSPADGIVKATTSLQAWCRDNRSVRAVA